MVLNYNMETVWHTVYQEIHRMSEWNKNLSSIEVILRERERERERECVCLRDVLICRYCIEWITILISCTLLL